MKLENFSDVDPVPFDPAATDADIVACYRLLLQRLPDKTGFTTFQNELRSRSVQVHELLAFFLSSPEFKFRQRAVDVPCPATVVQLAGFRMYVRENDWAVGRHVAELLTHEPHVTHAMRERLRPGMIVVDVGANIGYFSLLAASIVGNTGRVIAFEPSEANVTLIHRSAQLNAFENIIDVWPIGLSDVPRLMTLNLQATNGQLFASDGKHVSESEAIVKCKPLDDLLQLDRIDIVKIDVEGSEALVVRGAAKHLSRLRPVVFTEFSPPSLSVISGITGTGYLQFWLELGYRFSVITPDHRLVRMDGDIGRVTAFFDNSGSSHIDLLLEPEP